MADVIDRTATGVRIDSRRREYVVHGLIAATTRDDIGGRQYLTGCRRYLYADDGAILTTRKVSCAPCNGTAVPHTERAAGP